MDYYYIFAGACVGFIVGLTGVGGGSLMTPLLVLGFNVQPIIAVGTDLLYAALTKASGVISHHKLNNIDWTITKHICMGSIPGALLCIFIIGFFQIDTVVFEKIISVTLGFMLIITAFVILFKDKFKTLHLFTSGGTKYKTIILGFILGVLVTISSVGAGAIGSALLLMLYPKLSAQKIIGTDIAHAVPLTAIAGLGHLQLGNVDIDLLVSLLIGSIPAIHFGAVLGKRFPDNLLKKTVAIILMLIGFKFAV